LQFIGSSAWFIDESRGSHFHWYTYNTWQDVQGAVNAADQLAQSSHLHRVYIYTDQYTHEALTYLAAQMKTPVTLVSRSHCLVLPAPSQGPAVVLLGPADPLTDELLHRFGSATLMSAPPRLGGAPFHLYIVHPLVAVPDAGGTFGQTLSMAKDRPGTVAWNNPNHVDQPTVHLFETLWTSLKSWPTEYRTIYTYRFYAQYSGNGTDGQMANTNCNFSHLEPGERFLIPFELPAGSTAWPASLALGGSIWKSQPYILRQGPLSFESIRDQSAFQASLGNNIKIHV